MLKINTQIIGYIDLYEIYLDEILKKTVYTTVFIGRDIKKDNKIIIKRLSNDINNFIDSELNILKIIKESPHKNIITCFDIIETIDYTYIILEYCDIGDLTTVINNKIIDIEERENIAYNYFKQILEALKYLDDMNILHRDIKPTNILLKKSNNNIILKLCDFGLAKKRILKRTSTICGSPLYMAPEIFIGNYDNNTDIWALGMILYEMIFGVHPYYKCKDIDELTQNINIKIKIPNNISKYCKDLLEKMLEPDISKRIILCDIYEHKFIKNNNIIKNEEINCKINDDMFIFEP